MVAVGKISKGQTQEKRSTRMEGGSLFVFSIGQRAVEQEG